MDDVKKYRADWRHVVETEFDDAQYVGIADYDAQRLRADTAEAELAKFDEGMRSLACSLGAGGYNAETLTADQLVGKVQWGIDNLLEVHERRLTAAEQRNDCLAVLLRRADDFMYIMTGSNPEKHLNKNWEAAIEVLRGEIAAALNPKPEAGSHE